MQVTVLAAGFGIGVSLFVAWLLVMLRHDRTHRVQWIASSHEHARMHRRAALAAQYPPAPRPAVPVVRPGSFCRVPGNIGHSKNGTVLVCEASDHGRPRWRRAEVFKIAS
jgi:hypothetical protein